jgi:N-acetylneuraminic acid mutarotase
MNLDRDLEGRLRAGLRSIAEQQEPPADLSLSVQRRVRGRQVRRQRALATAVVVVVAAAAAIFGITRPDGTNSVDTVGPSRTSGWTELPALPVAPRWHHISLAMGDEVLVVGGVTGGQTMPAPGAAVLDLAANEWRTVPDPPADLQRAFAAWTGEVAYVAGLSGDFVAFDPATDEWTQLPATPFLGQPVALDAVVWTGDELLAFAPGAPGGGRAGSTTTVAAFDPANDAWTERATFPVALDGLASAVWTGHEVLIGGRDLATSATVVVAFDPDADSWSEVTPPPLAKADTEADRQLGFAGWTGTELVVGGGTTIDRRSLGSEIRHRALDVAAYNPTTQTWRPLPEIPEASQGAFEDEVAPATWTGRVLVVVETTSPDTRLGTPTGRLLLLDPASGRWTVAAAGPNGFHQGAPATVAGDGVLWVSGEPTVGDADPMSCCQRPTAAVDRFTP